MNSRERGKLREAETPIESLWSLFVYVVATGKLRWWPEKAINHVKWLDEAGSIHRASGYRRVKINGRYFKVHRIIWALHYGAWPDGEIDHINGIKTDNRIDNLRVVTHEENSRNRPKRADNTSGHTGVYRLPSGRVGTRISSNGRERWLGTFDTEAEAIAAVKTARVKHGFHPNHGRD